MKEPLLRSSRVELKGGAETGPLDAVGRKDTTTLSPVTFPSDNRFSEFFFHQQISKFSIKIFPKEMFCLWNIWHLSTGRWSFFLHHPVFMYSFDFSITDVQVFGSPLVTGYEVSNVVISV